MTLDLENETSTPKHRRWCWWRGRQREDRHNRTTGRWRRDLPSDWARELRTASDLGSKLATTRFCVRPTFWWPAHILELSQTTNLFLECSSMLNLSNRHNLTKSPILKMYSPEFPYNVRPWWSNFMQYCGLFVLVTCVQHIVLHRYALMLILHAAEILEIDLKIWKHVFCMKNILWQSQ